MGLTIFLTGAQGQVVGGGVAGPLFASSPVMIMAASFKNATFDHLPIDNDDEVSVAIQNQNCHCSHHRQNYHRQVDVSDLYTIPHNLITSGSPEIYSWAPGRPLPKS